MTTFDQLNDAEKAAACEHHRYWNVEHFEWWDCEEENLKADLKEVGFDVDKVFFSGFACQGDGASFTGHICDHELWLRFRKMGRFAFTAPEIITMQDCWWSVKIKQDGRYFHDGTMSCEEEWGGDHIHGDAVEEIADDCLEWCKERARKYYKELDDQYYYLISDEAIGESLECNETDLSEFVEDDMAEAA